MKLEMPKPRPEIRRLTSMGPGITSPYAKPPLAPVFVVHFGEGARFTLDEAEATELYTALAQWVAGLMTFEKGGDPTMAVAEHLADAEISQLYAQTGIDLTTCPPIMTAAQLGRVLGLSEGALAQDRYRGEGIPFTKIGRRRVRYLRVDVARFLLANRSAYPSKSGDSPR